VLARVAELDGPCRLTVTFEGEPAIDCGGVCREFFQLGSKILFSPVYSMFRVVRDSLHWFTDNSFESMDSYEGIGCFVGLAVVNRIPLPVRFPRLFYKKLLGIPTGINDIVELDEELASNLQKTRQYREDGNDVADLSLTFAVTQDNFGQVIEIPFFDGGEHEDVTSERLDEYLRLRTQLVLDGSVHAQFEAFRRGFQKCCYHEIFTRFTPDEFDILVSGEPEYDWPQLKAGARYNGYNAQSEEVNWFWETFEELTEEQKKTLLIFACGNDAVPLGGLRTLGFRIDKDSDPKHLPTSHTCFNTLILPKYPGKQMLKEKLLLALANATGFGNQ
jgi:hypothetical protein